MANYTAKITETTHELTARERILLKDTTNAIKLDEAVDNSEDGKVILRPVDYAVISIHNEKSKDRKDYDNYIIIDESGEKYVTGSPSFWSNFKEIWSEMEGEAFEIEVYKKPSKNYSGKDFITCSII